MEANEPGSELARTDDLHGTAAQRLRSAGLRYTSSRRAVMDVLAASDRPLTIPEILELEPELAQSSAYRNLNEMISAGVVHRIRSGDEYSHFELSQDLTEHHHHLICTHCGQVTDITLDDEFEATMGRTLDEVARSADFTSEHHRLDVFGRCRSC